MAKITQNVVFLNGKTVESVEGNDWTSKNGETTGTFKDAVSVSDTIVFESHAEGHEHLNAIYARGKKFGGLDVNTAANKISANGADYSLVVNNGKLEIQKFVPLTDVSVSGTGSGIASWERDSGAQTTTWTGSYAPSDASGTIIQSWTAVVEGGATIGSNSGNTITFTTIPNNATVTYTFSAIQKNGETTVAEPTPKSKSTSWWTRKAAVIVSSNDNLSVTGNTGGGFSFTIDGTTYTTDTTGIYIPGTSQNGLSDFTSSKNFGGTYTGFIYVLQSANVKSFSKYITKNGAKGLAKETFTRVSETPIKTYSDGAQSLYLYRSNGQQADISSIALTD